MRRTTALLSLALLLAAAGVFAQEGPKVPNPADIYCSGQVTTETVPHESYIISGEESYLKGLFANGDLVFINRGSSQGVKEGDEFLVTRPVKDKSPTKWFRWQWQMLEAMGTLWLDLGRIRVVHVRPDLSVARVVYSCDPMQRGDYIQPFAQRPAPPLPMGRIDPFAPETKRGDAMVVFTKDFHQSVGANQIIYINAGRTQGVNVGDTIRIFRYQGSRYWDVYTPPYTAHSLFDQGKTPRPYIWNELPRDIAGEGLVLRVSENASTVLVTSSLREIYLGYYVELK